MRLTVRVEASSPALAAVVDGAGADVTAGGGRGLRPRTARQRPARRRPARAPPPGSAARARRSGTARQPSYRGVSLARTRTYHGARSSRRQCWWRGQEYVVRPPIVRRSSGVPSRGQRPPRSAGRLQPPEVAATGGEQLGQHRPHRPQQPPPLAVVEATRPGGPGRGRPATGSRRPAGCRSRRCDPGPSAGPSAAPSCGPATAASCRGRMAKASTPSLASSGSSSTPPSRRGSFSRSCPPPAKLERRTGPTRRGRATTRTPAPRCPGARRPPAARSSRSAARAPGRRRTCRAAGASPAAGPRPADGPRARRPAPAPSAPA